MLFTDDDLKRFVCSDDRIATMKEVALREEDYLGLALLARLEAAEECSQGLAAYVEHEHRYWSDPEPQCKGHNSIDECDFTMNLRRQFKRSIEAWRKACGK
jgi:hypothetical protein